MAVRKSPLLAVIVSFLFCVAAFAQSGPNGGPSGPTGPQQQQITNSVAYLGQVATHSTLSNQTNGTFTNSMVRSRHIARDNITSVQLAFANWYVPSNGVETGTGSTATITASVEYPVGTCTQVKFSASASGSIPTASTTLSDVAQLSIAIPKGAAFFTRQYFVNPNGNIFTIGEDTANGEAFNVGGVGIVDRTVSCDTVPENGGGGFSYRPVAIVAPTVLPSVYIIGDSRVAGTNDVYSGTSSDLGEIARSIGPTLAYINGGCPSDQASFFVSSHTLRLALAGYASDIILQLGINDANAGFTAAQIQGNLATISGYFRGTSSVFVSTQPPYTTSTDSWATLANQTLTSGNSARIAVNDWKRTVPAGYAGVFDVASIMESSFDSGKWIVNGTANAFTRDGLHEQPTGYLLIQGSGVVNASAIHR